eukprot:COSAG02_NODE_6592_length_3474_cov_1.889185_2_plen_94_part_00
MRMMFKRFPTLWRTDVRYRVAFSSAIISNASQRPARGAPARRRQTDLLQVLATAGARDWGGDDGDARWRALLEAAEAALRRYPRRAGRRDVGI